MIKNLDKVVGIMVVIMAIVIMTGSNKIEKEDKINHLNEEVSYYENYSGEKKEEIEKVEPVVVPEEIMTETEAVTYFNNVEEEVNDYLVTNNFEEVKDEVNNLFIKTVDFVFYGKEINGVTFNELTDDAKAKILAILERMDNAIETKCPGYKDQMGELYRNVSDKVKEGLELTDNYIESKIGEERYQGIKDATIEFGTSVKEITIDGYNGAKEIAKKGIDKLKNWYENMREN